MKEVAKKANGLLKLENIYNCKTMNVKQFIMTFGRDFTFVGNQYHPGGLWRRTFPRLAVLQSRVLIAERER